MTLNRRQFVKNSTLALAGAALVPQAGLRGASGFDARIDVIVDESLGVISPEIYGHFTENLGGVVYDGIWVGPDSKIPNTHGIRKALTDALQKIKAPVIRWPGGCFADSYDWKDGIGPVAKRPRRSNLWGSYQILKRQGEHPAEVRSESVWDQRVHRILPFVGQRALPRREHAQPASARFLSMDRILQFARGEHHARRYARGRR